MVWANENRPPWREPEPSLFFVKKSIRRRGMPEMLRDVLAKIAIIQQGTRVRVFRP